MDKQGLKAEDGRVPINDPGAKTSAKTKPSYASKKMVLKQELGSWLHWKIEDKC